jgi:hypothetical protein
MRLACLPGFAPLIALVLAGCGAPEQPIAPQPPVSAPPPPAPADAALPVPYGAEGVLARVRSTAEVPLSGHRVDAKAGDWMLENAGSVAIVSAEGKLVDFGARGGRDEMQALDARVFLGLDPAHAEIVKIEPSPGVPALHVERRILEKPLTLHLWFYFNGPVLKIESAAAASAPAAATLAITLGEIADWGNVPTWVEGNGFVTRSGTLAGDFLARESFGVAYALGAEAGRIAGRFGGGDPGFHASAFTGEETIPVPASGLSAKRVIAVAQSPYSLGRAAVMLPSAQRGGLERAPLPPGLPAGSRVEVARCTPDGKPGARWARFAPEEREVWLPRGCAYVRATAPGHAASAWIAPAAIATLALPPAGTLRFAVTEKKKAIPARVLVRGTGQTADPDWGDDPSAGAALSVIYSDKGIGERELPPGTYHVTVDRGFEYTAVEQDVTIAASATVEVRAELDRVVDTRGFIAADLHLHAVPSPDAPQLLEDRVRALVASGVEVGVATDHNAVTDYGPTIRAMGMNREIASVVGDEITTKDPYFGHFNTFPLPPGGTPIAWKASTPQRIFADARAAGSLGPGTLVQVNHPRMGGIGYFDLMHLDTGDLAGFFRRAPLASMGFDAIEIFNGDHYAQIARVEECMKDWYALLNAGFHFTATGNSDSHKMTFQEAGVPRNLVLVPRDDPAAFDERAFVDAVRRGRVVVSSGPFIRLEVNGQPVGSSVPAGAVDIAVKVDAPPWVDVDQVQILRRGEPLKEWTGLSAARGAGAVRVLDTTFKETLRKGDWIIAIARGNKPMAFLYRSGATPFAFTNPIWAE